MGVPLRVTVLTRSDETAYTRHFTPLFNDLDMKLDDSNRLRWIGSSMDFSVAQRNAHAQALQAAVTVNNPDVTHRTVQDISANSIRGCEFHFMNAVTKVARTRLSVDAEQEDQFRNRCRNLITVEPIRLVDEVARFLKDFPNVAGWLSWWLREGTRQMLFSHGDDVERSTWLRIANTNNRAESMNSFFKRGSPQEKLQFVAGLEAVIRILRFIEASVQAKRDGMSLRYKQPPPASKSPSRSPARPYKNDGIPPKNSRRKVTPEQVQAQANEAADALLQLSRSATTKERPESQVDRPTAGPGSTLKTAKASTVTNPSAKASTGNEATSRVRSCRSWILMMYKLLKIMNVSCTHAEWCDLDHQRRSQVGYEARRNEAVCAVGMARQQLRTGQLDVGRMDVAGNLWAVGHVHSRREAVLVGEQYP